mmetsp:Transcript_19874/g.49339  ORF Transcript_19874/g.49339 Transcript_19874/m.49339 type:complete len:222 (-) Transcript_19874:2671-3336(-)
MDARPQSRALQARGMHLLQKDHRPRPEALPHVHALPRRRLRLLRNQGRQVLAPQGRRLRRGKNRRQGPLRPRRLRRRPLRRGRQAVRPRQRPLPHRQHHLHLQGLLLRRTRLRLRQLHLRRQPRLHLRRRRQRPRRPQRPRRRGGKSRELPPQVPQIHRRHRRAQRLRAQNHRGVPRNNLREARILVRVGEAARDRRLRDRAHEDVRGSGGVPQDGGEEGE